MTARRKIMGVAWERKAPRPRADQASLRGRSGHLTDRTQYPSSHCCQRQFRALHGFPPVTGKTGWGVGKAMQIYVQRG
jgi:hypothetical protein